MGVVLAVDHGNDLPGGLRDGRDLNTLLVRLLARPWGEPGQQVGGPNVLALSRGGEDKALVAVGLEHDKVHSWLPRVASGTSVPAASGRARRFGGTSSGIARPRRGAGLGGVSAPAHHIPRYSPASSRAGAVP